MECEEKLDRLILLYPYRNDWERVRPAWEYAREVGEMYAKEYWDPQLSMEKNIRYCGVKEIQKVDSGIPLEYRARFLPDRKIIQLSMYNYNECIRVMEKYDHSYTKEIIWKLILYHEAFHALEETQPINLEEQIQKRFGWIHGTEFRDVAAHRFANYLSENVYFCQMIDYRWMQEFAPKELAKREKECQVS